MAPIRLETGRYERLQVEQRTCFQCVDNVETEEHVLLMCPLYDDLRLKLFDSLITYFPFFGSLNESQKLSVILSCDHIEIMRLCAKTCFEILMRRRSLLYH